MNILILIKMTLGNMMYLISSKVQNLLTKESYILKTPNSQLKSKMSEYMESSESEITSIADIIFTILSIRNQAAHGEKVSRRDINIFFRIYKNDYAYCNKNAFKYDYRRQCYYDYRCHHRRRK